MRFSRIPFLFLFTHLAASKQPSAPSAIKAPLRDLPWGSLNFLHTTDTHGWHGGHLQEAQYSADWGDYISFASHLRKRADDDGSDLLLIDTGDRVEGNGLYDASDPKGNYTYDIVKWQHIDVITVGNHELYKNTTSAQEYEKMTTAFKDAYIASNLNISSPKDGKNIPFGPRYRKFTTQNQNITILAMGFIYDFRGNANNTIVQKVEDTVKEAWFQDAIRSKDVDLFLIAGHVALRNATEYDTIFKAIRSQQWDTPIVFFSGHTHIRDYRRFDSQAYGIESGRFMETIGFQSISGLSTGDGGDKDVLVKAKPKYERLYIDNNLYSFYHHSHTNESTFDTQLGRNVSRQIADARKEMGLDRPLGCALRDYWLYRSEYPSSDSILSLLDEHILPDTFTNENSSANPAIVLVNSGALRFDIFKGPFTKDTTYLICPFTSAFRMIRNVPYDAASKVLGTLNSGPPIFPDAEERSRLRDFLAPRPPMRAESIPTTTVDFAAAGYGQMPMKDKPEDLIPGYTTHDDAGDEGDDTLHSLLPVFYPPNIVGANIGFSASDSGDDEKLPEKVDLVYNEYIQNVTLETLRALGVSYGVENTKVVLEGITMTDIIGRWVEGNWEC